MSQNYDFLYRAENADSIATKWKLKKRINLKSSKKKGNK